MPSATRDYSALATPVDPAEVAEFRKRSLAIGRMPAQQPVSNIVIGSILGVIFGVPTATIFITLIAYGLQALVRASGLPDGPANALSSAIVPALLLLAALALTYGIVQAVRQRRQKWVRFLMQERFAADNGLRFSPRDDAPRYPGVIFRRGDARKATDHFMSLGRPLLDLGN